VYDDDNDGRDDEHDDDDRDDDDSNDGVLYLDRFVVDRDCTSNNQ
jgi:hypothetical protein